MGCEFREHEGVNALEERGGHLVIKTDKSEYDTKAVIIAVGAGLFKPKKLGVSGEEKFEGKGVYYKLPDKESLIGKQAIFVGGGNSALEMALLICGESETCIVHRRDTFRADESVVEKVERSNIERIMNAAIVEIKGTDKVESVVIKEGNPPKLVERPVDAVIVNIGTATEAADLMLWGVELDEGLIKVDTDMRTSKKGVFACGDVVAYKGKYKQIVVACGEAAIASNSAYKFIKEPYWAEKP